ncbi:MAG: PadR family transcriptional regulator [Promethearchaeota archaeon]
MTSLNELTQSEIAILSLLSEGEQHGYGLNEAIEQRGFRNWTNIGFSSIYWILNRMEKAKLITSRKDPSKKGPERKLYRLAQKGQSALLDSIRGSISIPEHIRTQVDLGAAYVELLPREEAIRCFETYRKTMQERINGIAAVRKAQEPLPFGAQIIFDHGTIKGKAELEWVDGVLERLKQQQEN